jgi:nicotinate-nucleotide adenylyltransferase
MTVGLLGGSFDPAHEGHVHITKEALKRFRLDRVWWLVSPGNPLKTEGPAPIDRRIAAARAVMDHPRVTITDIETRLGTRYTAETLSALRRAYPGVNFIWLMGADNLRQFHKWDNWHAIMGTVPVGVLARPGSRTDARVSKAASIYAKQRLPGRHARDLPRHGPPVWCFANMPMNDASSTEIRSRGQWVR